MRYDTTDLRNCCKCNLCRELRRVNDMPEPTPTEAAEALRRVTADKDSEVRDAVIKHYLQVFKRTHGSLTPFTSAEFASAAERVADWMRANTQEAQRVTELREKLSPGKSFLLDTSIQSMVDRLIDAGQPATGYARSVHPAFSPTGRDNTPKPRMQPIERGAFDQWVAEQQKDLVPPVSPKNVYLDRLQAAIDVLEEILEDDDDGELDSTDKRIMLLRVQEIRVLTQSNI